MKQLISLLFFLFFSMFAIAQWIPDTIILKKPYYHSNFKPADVIILNPTFHIKKYNIQQGLPGAYITCVMTDSKGYLWFGTYGGGCGRYNGSVFDIYTEDSGLPSNYIEKVFQDSRGGIWVATYGKGVGLFSENKWTIYNDSTGFSGKYVWDICEDKNGNIWFAVERMGAIRYDDKEFKNYTPEDGLCSKDIRAVYSDSKGVLWFGSDGRGVTAFDGKTFKSWTTSDGLPDNRVVSITEWNNKLWMGTYGGGLCNFVNGTFIVYNDKNGLSNNLISSISAGKGRLLIATSGGGVSVFDGNSFRNITSENGLSNDITLSVCEDIYGNIWTGTFGGGISEIMNNTFRSYSEANGFPVNVVKSMISTGNGKWLGFSGGGLGLLRNDTLFQLGTENGLPNEYVLALTKDADGNLWAGTSGAGLLRFTEKEYQQISNWHGLPGNYILSLFCDKKQRLWIGTYGTGFGYLYNDTIIWFRPNKDHHPEYINAFREKGDSLYIATDNGLFGYVEGKLSEINLPDGPGKSIKSLMFDKDDRMWIGTSGSGLWVRTSGGYVKMTGFGATSAGNIESVFTSDEGCVFIGLWNGILKLIPVAKEKRQLSLPRFLEYYIKYYNNESGFSGYNCLTNSCLTGDGKIFVGTGQCLVGFDPEPETFNNIVPPVELFEIRKDFSPLNWKDLIDSGMVKTGDRSWVSGIPADPSFSYNYNNLTFCIRSINLNYHSLCRISYRLKGFDETFSPPLSTYEIKYSNLPPGDYCLEVFGINENGIRSEVPFTYPFSVMKPWWETWWFRAIYISFIVILLFSIYSIRISVLKRRQRVLEQRIAEATVEIRQKNEALEQQNEEIISQRDEIEAQRDEITTQRDILAEQKEHIEFIHEEQTSSIRYALRIQQAMLPSLDLLNESGLEHFLFFHPRDIVSGDFYWVGRQENILIITVADCTGHGVPGAFMSMLGIAFLKEIVMKEYITQPDVILKKLRKEIVRSLKQNEDANQKDGMDIALCTINLDTLELQFAGANNPLYIVTGCSSLVTGELNQQPETSNQKLIELKPDKMPIGIHERMDPFTLHTQQLQKGDCIYMFSDGIADQFGGPAGKKFKYKPLKELLMTNSRQPMATQKESVDKLFSEWKGSLEQVDDVTIMGIKL